MATIFTYMENLNNLIALALLHFRINKDIRGKNKRLSISKYYVQKRQRCNFICNIAAAIPATRWSMNYCMSKDIQGYRNLGEVVSSVLCNKHLHFFKFKGFHDNVSATAVLLGISHGNSMGGNVWMEVLIRHESSHQSFMRLLTAYVLTMIFPNLLRHTRQIMCLTKKWKNFLKFLYKLIYDVNEPF